MNLEEWFLKGVTAQDYIKAMEKHQDNLTYIYEHFQVPNEDSYLFEQLQKRDLRAIILTEDWCGDAMLNIPIFLRLAEAAHIHTRILLRDENLDLMDQYLTNGRSRSIPKIIVINSNGEEVSHWGPRAPKLQQFIDRSITTLPDKEAEDFKEKQTEMFKFISKSYCNNPDFWEFVYEDLKNMLKN